MDPAALRRRGTLPTLRRMTSAHVPPLTPESVDVPVVLRRAEAGDVPALVALENRVFTADRLSARQWRRHVVNAGAAVIVAVRGEALLGAAVVFFRVGLDIARLYSIARAPETRGLGLGERLLEAAEAAARARGATRMRLEVREDNVAAQQLYTRRGYAPIGRRDGYYEDGADALRFEKRLDGG